MGVISWEDIRIIKIHILADRIKLRDIDDILTHKIRFKIERETSNHWSNAVLKYSLQQFSTSKINEFILSKFLCCFRIFEITWQKRNRIHLHSIAEFEHKVHLGIDFPTTNYSWKDNLRFLPLPFGSSSSIFRHFQIKERFPNLSYFLTIQIKSHNKKRFNPLNHLFSLEHFSHYVKFF